MVELTVYDEHAGVKEKVNFDETIFGTKVKKILLRGVILAHEAACRQGNACAKTRGERQGSGKKPWKQKGTGRARAGSVRSPLWRGGGRIFGPKPKDYTQKINKSARKEALRTALLAKFRDNEVVVLEDIKLDSPKTKTVAKLLSTISAPSRTLLVTKEYNEVVYKSFRNIKGLNVIPLSDLNAYDIIRAHSLLFLRSALDDLKGRIAK